MIVYDEEAGSTRLVRDSAFALIGSVAITVKDVHRYSDSLKLEDPFAIAKDLRLKMVDCRTYDMKEVYMDKILGFLTMYIDKVWSKEYGIPAAHIAHVLLHIYNERENLWKTCAKPKNAKTITTFDKEKVPALITNPHEYGAFLLSKVEVPPEKRTFYVVFPGYDVFHVPSTRDAGIQQA